MVTACRKPNHLIRQLTMTSLAWTAAIVELFIAKSNVIHVTLDLKRMQD
ncbi:MAG: hypothetical protein ACJ72Q_11230 [Nitrososphaeraceae archaeon]